MSAAGVRVASTRPLEGVCVLVTRAAHQAEALVAPLAALGAEVLTAPMIDTIDPTDWEPVDAALGGLGSYDWVVFTSTNAVDRFLARGGEAARVTLAKGAIRVAAVGPATAERLREAAIQPELVPSDARAEGLVADFEAEGVGVGARVLIPRAESAREILPDALRKAGAVVDVAPVYRTVPAVPAPDVLERLRAGDVNVVTFTSPSTVRHFVSWLGADGLDAAGVLGRAAAASIGPVTSEALSARGLAVPIVAQESTMAGLVAAIVASFGGPPLG